MPLPAGTSPRSSTATASFFLESRAAAAPCRGKGSGRDPAAASAAPQPSPSPPHRPPPPRPRGPAPHQSAAPLFGALRAPVSVRAGSLMFTVKRCMAGLQTDGRAIRAPGNRCTHRAAARPCTSASCRRKRRSAACTAGPYRRAPPGPRGSGKAVPGPATPAAARRSYARPGRSALTRAGLLRGEAARFPPSRVSGVQPGPRCLRVNAEQPPRTWGHGFFSCLGGL